MEIRFKFNNIYRPAMQAKERYRIIYGGAGSGKSYFVIGQETLLNMMNDSRHRYLIVRKTKASIKRSVYQQLLDGINEIGVNSLYTVNKTDLSLTCKNGATVHTSGLDDTEKLKSITGINRIIIEEGSEITENDMKDLDLRMRGQSHIGYQMTQLFNPVSEQMWQKKKYIDNKAENTFILKTTYKDNPYIDEAYKRVLEEYKKTDWQYWRIYGLGEFGTVEGLIFRNWQRGSVKDITFDNYYNGLDWGFSQDPTAVIRIAYDKLRKTIYVLDEVYETEMHTDEIANRLKSMIGNERIICDSAEPRSISDLQRQGIRAEKAVKGAGSIEHGIKFLQGHKIIVQENCINTINELSGYRWKEDRYGNTINKPVDANNHLIDALRYALEPEMTQSRAIGINKRMLGV